MLIENIYLQPLDRVYRRAVLRCEGGDASFPELVEGPKSLKSEVRTAIRMMRRNKAPGPYGVVIEIRGPNSYKDDEKEQGTRSLWCGDRDD